MLTFLSHSHLTLQPEIYRIESQIFFATRKILESLYQKFAKPLLKAGDPPIDPAPPISQLVSWVSALKQLLPVFTAMVVDQLAEGKGGDRPGRDCLAATPWPETEDDPHSRVCDFCRCDIWNRGWSCGVCSGEKSKDDDDDEDEDEEKAGTSADRRGARMEAKENGDAANGDGAPTPGEASATGLLGVSRAPSLLEEDLDIQAQQTEANGAGALQDGPSDSPALPPIDLSSPCHFDLCNRCFMLGRSCAHPDKMRLKGYVSLSKQRKYIRRFYEVYNAAVRKLKEMRQQGVEGLEAMDSIEEMPNPVDSEDNFVEKRETLTTGTVAYNRFLALKAKVTKMCHSCKAAKLDWLACPECETRYCNVCLWHRYGMRIGECRQLGETWECPRCNDACNCVACMRNRGANFAPFPRPQGIVCLAGWNQHLDEVSGLAVHDVAPPKGPSYNTDGFTVGPPPAEWIAENRGSDEEEEKDERAVRSTNSRRGAPAESSKKAAKASSEPEDEDVLESVADPMDEDQEDKRRRRSNVSSKAKGKQVVRGRAPSAPAPASRNRGNQKRAASSEPESESEPEPERKAKAKPRKSVGSSQQRLTLDDVLRRFRGVVRLLHICLKTNQWIDAFQMVKLLREEVGSHGIAMFDSVDENADAFVRIIPLLLTYADFDETEDVVRGFEKMVRRHFKENPWPWPEMTEAGPPRGGSRAPAAAAKKRKDESEDEDEPESGLSPRKRRKSGTYAERDSDDEEASDGSASEPTGRSRRASTGAPLKREQDRKRARLSAPLPSRSGKKPAPSEKHGLFAPKIESVEGLCNGNTVRAQFYRLPRTEAIFMWNRATGWINWTKVATPLGIKGNVGDLKPADHETLLGSRYVQGRWWVEASCCGSIIEASKN